MYLLAKKNKIPKKKDNKSLQIMFSNKIQFLSILFLMTLTLPRQTFNKSLGEAVNHGVDLKPELFNILDSLQKKLKSQNYDQKDIQHLMSIILQRALEMERQREEQSSYWYLRQGR